MIYVDTSAIVKRMLGEDGADLVTEIFAGTAPRVSSRLLDVELHAVVDRRGLPAEWIEAVRDGVSLIALDDGIAARAIELRSGLRPLDALHLATAMLISAELTGFLSFDAELNAAARARGLPVLVDDA